MKKLLLAISAASLCFQSFSQCGVQSSFTVNPAFSSSAIELVATPLLQPGWIIYSYEWKENDNVISNQPGFDYGDAPWIGTVGFNLITLTVGVIDTIANDTCYHSHSEILQNNFQYGFGNIEVVAENGLNIDFYISSLNNAALFNNSFNIDFGDGTSTSTNGAWYYGTHNYSVPGTYTVTVNIWMPFIFNIPLTVSRTVHVLDGYTNIIGPTLYNYPRAYGCSPFAIAVPTNSNIVSHWSSFVFGTYGYLYDTLNVSQPYVSSVMDVPGQAYAQVTFNDSGNVAYSHYYSIVTSPQCVVPPDTIYGFVWNDTNFNGVQDTGESPLPGANITLYGCNYGTVSDSMGNYSIIVPHIVTSIDANASGFYKSIPLNAYSIYFKSGISHYGYNFGLAPLNQVCGKTFIDINNDSIFTANLDLNLPSATLQLRDTLNNFFYYTTTNTNGDYCTFLPFGNYMIKPINYLLDSAIIYPDSLYINQTGTNLYNQNFAFTSNYSGGNFNISINSSHPPRPGFNYSLISRVENTGIDSITGNIVLDFDSVLLITTINPSNGTVDTANHTITWNTGYIKPASFKYFTANFTVSVSTPLGYALSNSAFVNATPINTDHDTTNNTATFFQTVIGSYDPNDKSVYPNGYGIAGDVHHNTQLNYRINFQNTGTASAFNIVVQDTIDTDLDMNTFLMHRASHAYSFIINGNIISWKFSNINLPDSNSNEPLSHGFIEYSIKPKQGLPDGTGIENNAQIYFDFNSPITTNTTLNTLQTVITSASEITKASEFLIYPNPASNKIIVSYPKLSGKGTLQIFDITGKQVYKQNLPQWSTLQYISLPKLANGLYQTTISSDTFRINKKVIIFN